MKKIHFFKKNAKVRIKKQPHDFVGLCWARSTKMQLENHGEVVDGIRSLYAIWNQHKVLYVINPKEDTRWRVMPYAFGDYILTCGEITCQSFGLDRKKTV